MLYEYEEDYVPEDYIIPTKCIEEIERQMGHPITFMGIS